jgi:iron complex outermembrane receptor protein
MKLDPASVFRGVLVVGLVLVPAGPALAQTETPSEKPQEEAPQGEVEEQITVTAQKREEKLQEVPISITAYTEKILDAVVATELHDITQRTPNFQYVPCADLKLCFPSIRGIASAGGGGAAAPTVGFYVDQVFLGNNTEAQFDLFDIERIEVLRGPQGTMYGVNTIGGVMNVVTSKPQFELGGRIDLLAGNYEYTRGRVSLTGPVLGEKGAGKIAGLYNLRDKGYVDNVFDGTTGNDNETTAVRGELQFLPSDTAVINVTGDYRHINQHSKYFDILGESPLLDALSGFDFDTDPYDRETNANTRGTESLDGWGSAVTAEISFDSFLFTSVSGYREHDYFNRGDTDMSPVDWVGDGDPEEQYQFTQEVRFTSTTTNIADWIGGLYYFHQSFDNQSYVEFYDDFNGIVLGLPPGLVLFDQATGNVVSDSYAAFGHATFHLTDQLELAVGARYTQDEKEIEYFQTSETGFFPVIAPKHADDSWDAFTPSVNLSWSANQNLMIYGTANRGFKSGGYNQGLGEGPLTAAVPFDPEFLWNYEVGLKTTTFANRLALDLAIFDMDWSDIQIITDNPATPLFDPITLNAAKAHSTGAELEARLRATRRLEITGSVGLLDAEYDEDAPAANVAEGNDLSRTPNSTYGVSFNWTPVLGDGSDNPLSLRAEYLWTGDQFLTADNQPDGNQASYDLINGRIAWDINDRFMVALWGKNLGDETYLTRLFDLSGNPLVVEKLIALGPPRTYGLEVRFGF